MLTKKTIGILLVLTVLAVAAAVISRQADQPVAMNNSGPYFPELLERSNEVSKAIIKDAQATTTIEQNDKQWTIAEKGGYPASTDKVRELILGLARLKKLEPKTKDAARYAKLDLNDISEPGSKSRLLQLVDDAGQNLAVVVLGKSKVSAATRDQFYVRTPDDPQTWLVEGFLPALDDASVWMETTLIEPEDIGEVRSVTVLRDNESLVVARADAESTDFELQGLGSDEEIKSQYEVNQIAQSFKGLRMEDVQPAATAFDGSEKSEAILESFNGIGVKLSLFKHGDQNLARLKAEYKAEAEADDELEKKVATLNDLWGDWVYVLPDYQVESIFVAREDLLQQEEAEQKQE